MTFEKFNAAANRAAEVAFQDQVFSQPAIHKRCYAELRRRFHLPAQLAVRAIGKAVEVYKRDKKVQHKFKKLSAVVYDGRVLSIRGLETISLASVCGRLRMPFVMGAYQKARIGYFKGQADLIYRKKKFFVLLTIDMPDGTPIKPRDVVGVDLGIKNIAVDSKGNVHSGDAVEACRQRYGKLRADLQGSGTKSAKRHLKKLNRKEADFRRNENHRISKQIVALAKGTSSAIALEDLNGIGKRTTVRRAQRDKHSRWSFWQLRRFIEYKAQLVGIPVIPVDPRNTSRECSQCGHCDKKNRKSRDEFVCRGCNHSSPADLNAARNIRARAACQPAYRGVA